MGGTDTVPAVIGDIDFTPDELMTLGGKIREKNIIVSSTYCLLKSVFWQDVKRKWRALKRNRLTFKQECKKKKVQRLKRLKEDSILNSK